MGLLDQTPRSIPLMAGFRRSEVSEPASVHLESSGAFQEHGPPWRFMRMEVV